MLPTISKIFRPDRQKNSAAENKKYFNFFDIFIK
jgi:hypothetical protein